jgi:predicted dinucleotide-binding enzyme
MKIGIIGAGSMGATLARRLAAVGHDVSIASSRRPSQLAALAAEVCAVPATCADALSAAEVAFLAIPTKAVAELSPGLFARARRDLIVIDIGNYHPELRDGRIEAIERGLLDSQWVAQQIEHPVLKAFNNIFADSLRHKGVLKGTPGRIALPVAGDALDARRTVLGLVDELGFDPVDGSVLASSWRQGTGTPAYCQDLDAATLRSALAAADRNRIAEYRAKEEARIRSTFATDKT